MEPWAPWTLVAAQGIAPRSLGSKPRMLLLHHAAMYDTSNGRSRCRALHGRFWRPTCTPVHHPSRDSWIRTSALMHPMHAP